MNRLFARDLDLVLVYLNDYTGGSRILLEQLREHLVQREGSDVEDVHFAFEFLQSQGYIFIAELTVPRAVRITVQGRLFLEGGGFGGAQKQARREAQATIARIVARVAEAVVLILLAALTLWVQWGDRTTKESLNHVEERVKQLEQNHRGQ